MLFDLHAGGCALSKRVCQNSRRTASRCGGGTVLLESSTASARGAGACWSFRNRAALPPVDASATLHLSDQCHFITKWLGVFSVFEICVFSSFNCVQQGISTFHFPSSRKLRLVVGVIFEVLNSFYMGKLTFLDFQNVVRILKQTIAAGKKAGQSIGLLS